MCALVTVDGLEAAVTFVCNSYVYNSRVNRADSFILSVYLYMYICTTKCHTMPAEQSSVYFAVHFQFCVALSIQPLYVIPHVRMDSALVQECVPAILGRQEADVR